MLNSTVSRTSVACFGITDRWKKFRISKIFGLFVVRLYCRRRAVFPPTPPPHPFLFLFSLFIEFLCVEYTALSLRCIKRDAAFRDRKKKFLQVQLLGKNAICALRLTIVLSTEQPLICFTVIQTNSSGKRRFMCNQDKCS